MSAQFTLLGSATELLLSIYTYFGITSCERTCFHEQSINKNRSVLALDERPLAAHTSSVSFTPGLRVGHSLGTRELWEGRVPGSGGKPSSASESSLDGKDEELLGETRPGHSLTRTFWHNFCFSAEERGPAETPKRPPKAPPQVLQLTLQRGALVLASALEASNP